MPNDSFYPVVFTVVFIILGVESSIGLVKLLYAGSKNKNRDGNYPAWCVTPSVVLFIVSLGSFVMILIIAINTLRKIGFV